MTQKGQSQSEQILSKGSPLHQQTRGKVDGNTTAGMSFFIVDFSESNTVSDRPGLHVKARQERDTRSSC